MSTVYVLNKDGISAVCRHDSALNIDVPAAFRRVRAICIDTISKGGALRAYPLHILGLDCPLSTQARWSYPRLLLAAV